MKIADNSFGKAIASKILFLVFFFYAYAMADLKTGHNEVKQLWNNSSLSFVVGQKKLEKTDFDGGVGTKKENPRHSKIVEKEKYLRSETMEVDDTTNTEEKLNISYLIKNKKIKRLRDDLGKKLESIYPNSKDCCIGNTSISRSKNIIMLKKRINLLESKLLKYQKVIVSGGFCSGKTTLVRQLQENLGIPKLIDHSTRQMRFKEQQNFPYHFIERNNFELNIRNDYYHEWIEFNGNYYGVPKWKLFKYKLWAVDIVSSSLPFYEAFPGSISVFLESPPKELILERAKNRGDTEEVISSRLKNEFLSLREKFDVIIPAKLSIKSKLGLIEAILLEGIKEN